MPSKKVQTLFKNPNERNHRSHRSKRGRTKYSRDREAIKRKRRLDELREDVNTY